MWDLNYKDFYQKAIIPIGINDFSSMTNTASETEANYSHWLIALEGQLKDQEKEYYCWKVSVYPSNAKGSFSWNKVFYTSQLFECINAAFEHAKEIELSGKNDQLFSKNKHEKIS